MGKQLLLILRTILMWPINLFRKAAPTAMANAAIQQQTENIADARKAAGENQGMITSLKNQKQELERQEQTLLRRGKNQQSSGDTAAAQITASELVGVRENLGQVTTALENAERRQAGYLQVIQRNQAKTKNAKTTVKTMDTRRRMARAENRMDEAFMDDGNLDDAIENLQDQAFAAEGQTTVNRQLDMSNYDRQFDVADTMAEFDSGSSDTGSSDSGSNSFSD
jgi:predicted  nucleic acid-binding Zn-ribbon protein